jgi:hypothetical protein
MKCNLNEAFGMALGSVPDCENEAAWHLENDNPSVWVCDEHRRGLLTSPQSKHTSFKFSRRTVS